VAVRFYARILATGVEMRSRDREQRIDVVVLQLPKFVGNGCFWIDFA
jgi:hypothetical protein